MIYNQINNPNIMNNNYNTNNHQQSSIGPSAGENARHGNNPLINMYQQNRNNQNQHLQQNQLIRNYPQAAQTQQRADLNRAVRTQNIQNASDLRQRVNPQKLAEYVIGQKKINKINKQERGVLAAERSKVETTYSDPNKQYLHGLWNKRTNNPYKHVLKKDLFNDINNPKLRKERLLMESGQISVKNSDDLMIFRVTDEDKTQEKILEELNYLNKLLADDNQQIKLQFSADKRAFHNEKFKYRIVYQEQISHNPQNPQSLDLKNQYTNTINSTKKKERKIDNILNTIMEKEYLTQTDVDMLKQELKTKENYDDDSETTTSIKFNNSSTPGYVHNYTNNNNTTNTTNTTNITNTTNTNIAADTNATHVIQNKKYKEISYTIESGDKDQPFSHNNFMKNLELFTKSITIVPSGSHEENPIEVQEEKKIVISGKSKNFNPQNKANTIIECIILKPNESTVSTSTVKIKPKEMYTDQSPPIILEKIKSDIPTTIIKPKQTAGVINHQKTDSIAIVIPKSDNNENNNNIKKISKIISKAPIPKNNSIPIIIDRTPPEIEKPKENIIATKIIKSGDNTNIILIEKNQDLINKIKDDKVIKISDKNGNLNEIIIKRSSIPEKKINPDSEPKIIKITNSNGEASTAKSSS